VHFSAMHSQCLPKTVAGTGEGIGARIHVANSHGDRAEEGRRSDRKHSTNSLWESDESCMSVGANIASQSRNEPLSRGMRGSIEVGSR